MAGRPSSLLLVSFSRREIHIVNQNRQGFLGPKQFTRCALIAYQLLKNSPFEDYLKFFCIQNYFSNYFDLGGCFLAREPPDSAGHYLDQDS